MKNKCVRILLFIPFILFSIYSSAQQLKIEGKLLDKITKKPVIYASLNICGTQHAAMTNGEGHFSFSAAPNDTTQQLRITSVGYQELSFLVSKFKNTFQTIQLTPETVNLNEVSIKAPQLYKLKQIGRAKLAMVFFSKMFNSADPIEEQGRIFEVPDNFYLKDFGFHVLPSSKFKAVKLKLNIYSTKNHLPDQLLNTQVIVIELNQTGWFKTDLTKYNLHIQNQQEIAVTCQLVEATPTELIPFSFGVSTIPSRKEVILTRHTNTQNWETSKGNLTYNFNISYLQEKGAKHSKKKEMENDEQNDSLQLLKKIYTFQKESKESGYGNNESKGNTVKLKDASIYYEVYGKGEPLILLHGNNGSIADFYQQIPEFSQHYQVFAIDTRGQGKSTDLSSGDFTYEQFSLDLKSVMDTLHLKNANILGWSDGGNTGLIMAIKYPEYVKKLVTLGAVLNPDGADDKVMQELKESLKANKSGVNITDRTNFKLLKLLINEPHIGVKELENIKIPVLVMAGEKDLIKQSHTELISKSIKGSVINLIPNATHYALQEEKEKFNNFVLLFYSSK